MPLCCYNRIVSPRPQFRQGQWNTFPRNPEGRTGMGLLIHIHAKWNLLDEIMNSIFYKLFWACLKIKHRARGGRKDVRLGDKVAWLTHQCFHFNDRNPVQVPWWHCNGNHRFFFPLAGSFRMSKAKCSDIIKVANSYPSEVQAFHPGGSS